MILVSITSITVCNLLVVCCGSPTKSFLVIKSLKYQFINNFFTAKSAYLRGSFRFCPCTKSSWSFGRFRWFLLLILPLPDSWESLSILDSAFRFSPVTGPVLRFSCTGNSLDSDSQNGGLPKPFFAKSLFGSLGINFDLFCPLFLLLK